MDDEKKAETADAKEKAKLERFNKAELTGTESIADLPIIARRYNFPPPDTAEDSPMSIMEIATSKEYQDLSKPKLTVGDPAADFTLPKLDMSEGKERDTGETVTLSDYLSTGPVALIFGSYT